VEWAWARGSAGTEVENLTLIDIQPDRDAFALSGSVIGENGAVNHAFRMTLWKFEWPYLHYCYESAPGGFSENLKGVGIFYFSSQRAGHHGPPTYFTGSFAPGGNSGSYRVVGRKLSDEECAQLANETEKRILIARYFSEFRAKETL